MEQGGDAEVEARCIDTSTPVFKCRRCGEEICYPGLLQWNWNSLIEHGWTLGLHKCQDSNHIRRVALDLIEVREASECPDHQPLRYMPGKGFYWEEEDDGNVKR